MNIACVLAYWHDRFGGPVTIVKKQGRALADMGHTISYWAPDEDDAGEETSPAGALHRYRCDWPRSWRRSKELVRALSLAAPAFDLIDVSELWGHTTHAASQVARAHGIPYVLRPAGGLEPWRLQHGHLRALKKKMYLKAVAKPIMDRAACLQAASTQELEGLRRVGYRGPVAIIPGGVDTATLQPGDPAESDEHWPELKNRPVVLFMSRLSPEKGLDLLVPLWADFVKAPAHRDALLVVAGPDYRGYRRTVEAMIERHGLQSGVRLVGMVQGPEKRALLSRADVFVLPSYSENFGIVVPEALACHTPVITTTGTPWQQLQSIDAGRQVSPTREGLTEALRELLAMSAAQREAMGRRGRELVERHYTWERVAGQFVTMCDCILKGKSIPLHPEPAPSPMLADA